MNLHRLTPRSLPAATRYYGGRCSACDKPLARHDTIAHLYGETFHYDCAFYRHGHDRSRRERRSKPA